jgi:broad specificity phosphatase PhoE
MPMRLSIARAVLPALVLLGCATRPATVAAPAATAAVAAVVGPTVIVVRHAEKGTTPANDPGLSAAGEARAQALAALLGGGRVTGIVTTQFQRTRLTAAPLAARRGLTPVVVPASSPVEAHAAAVAAAARAAGGAGDTVVVVGHSNTVAAIVHALGGAPQLPDLCDAQYATIYTVTPQRDGSARVTRASYGAADPADAASCHG